MPKREELLERIGPRILTLLTWTMASVVALPLLLSLVAPFLI